MAVRTEPPFRADHVGSLLRPPALLRRGRTSAAGRIDAEELRAVEDDAIRDVVRMQEDGRPAGRRPTASSAARRGTWTSSTSSAASRPADDKLAGRSSTTTRATSSSRRRRSTSTARSASRRRSSATPSAFLQETRRRRASPKLTIPSPSMVHYRGGRAAIDETVYPDLDEFWGDLDRRLPRGGAPARRARLHLPPARRHEPRLPQRPGAARATSRDRRRPGRTSTSSTSGTSTRRSPAGPRA